jgi:hypothetical protein
MASGVFLLVTEKKAYVISILQALLSEFLRQENRNNGPAMERIHWFVRNVGIEPLLDTVS